MSKPLKPFMQASTITGTAWLPIMQYDSQPKYGMTGRKPTARYCSSIDPTNGSTISGVRMV